MKNVVKFATLMSLMTPLVSCVEFKDNEPEAKPMVEVQAVNRLIVDRPLFIFNGRIVTAEDLEYEKFRRTQNASGSIPEKKETSDVEFKFDELYFAEGGVLYTMGANVRIHARTLSSANGRIITFPADQKAAVGSKGKDGGHILLNIGRGEGTLLIEMRGEVGGDGVPARLPDAALKGITGAKGKDGNCGAISDNGERGGKGLKGYPGYDGARGGGTGTLELIIEDSNQFTYVLQKIPGLGGTGSEGGQGGAGGDGGQAGDPGRMPGVLCLSGRGGNPGERGDKGDAGKSGPEGEKQTSCITKNKAMTCYN